MALTFDKELGTRYLAICHLDQGWADFWMASDTSKFFGTPQSTYLFNVL
jgi:hypothetical protein